ncbi:MAG: Uma2 family endonuclease [Chloroflexi bacterium]|nr:Uma2 family endonuclease [Chloroflexota bacterium]
MPDDRGWYELVRGAPTTRAVASGLAVAVTARLMLRLCCFVDEHEAGACGAAGGFQLSRGPDTVRVPDVWFVRAARVPADGLPETFWPGAPDLAAIVLSPSDHFVEVMQAVLDYLEAGTPLVWVLDPHARSAAVFRAEESLTFLDDNADLHGEDVLPGFSLPVRELFS